MQLSLDSDNGRMTIGAIATKLEVSQKYLGAILYRLREEGLLISHRGAAGGFAMGKDPRLVTVEEVYRILEGPTHLVECVEYPERCNRSRGCVARDLWKDLETGFRQMLASITLEDLAERHRALNHRGS